MSHAITLDYVKAALEQIEKGEGPYKRDPLAFAESVIEAQKKIAHDALNGEWEPVSPGDYPRNETAP